MGIETKYVCDRCDHTQDKPDQMWSMGIVYNEGVVTDVQRGVRYQHLWCRKCMIQTQILSGNEKERVEAKVPDPPPTFEDMILNLIDLTLGDRR